MSAENLNTREQLKDLFILRTDIDKRSEFLRVKYDLEKIKGIRACTIDLEDCDKVLRIECENIPMSSIVEKVRSLGFFCEELAD